MDALLVVLRSGDMESMELHAQLPRFDDAMIESAMASLDAAMSELEFEAAASACEAILQRLRT